MNCLARFCRSRGIEAYSMPKGFMPKKVKYRPYIFSDDEIKRLFESIDNSCKFSHIVPLRHLVLPVFFRTLYCCGLRVSRGTFDTSERCRFGNGRSYLDPYKKQQNKGRCRYIRTLLGRLRVYHDAVHPFSKPDAPFFPRHEWKSYDCWQCVPQFPQVFMACKDFSLREDSHRRNRSAKCAFAPPYVRCQLLEEVDETRQKPHAYLPVLQEYLGHVNHI